MGRAEKLPQLAQPEASAGSTPCGYPWPCATGSCCALPCREVLQTDAAAPKEKPRHLAVGWQFGSRGGDNEIIQECGPHHHACCGGLPDSVRAAGAPASAPPHRPRRASRLRSNRDLLPRWSMSSLAARKMSGSEITRSLLAIRSSLASPPSGACRAATSGLLADAGTILGMLWGGPIPVRHSLSNVRAMGAWAAKSGGV